MTTNNVYPLNTSGNNPQCWIPDESHSVQPPGDIMEPSWFPVNAGPFFHDTFKLYPQPNQQGTALVEGTDFIFVYAFPEASLAYGKLIFGGILLLNRNYSGTLYASYFTLGGQFVLDSATLLANYIQAAYNVYTVKWGQIQGVPAGLPPIDHSHDPSEIPLGMNDVVTALNALNATLAAQNAARPSNAYTLAINNALALLGLGINNLSTAKPLTSTDINTVVIPGNYYVGANCSNVPNIGLMSVWCESPTVIYQILQGSGNAGMWYRSFTTNVGPYNWKQVVDSDTLASITTGITNTISSLQAQINAIQTQLGNTGASLSLYAPLNNPAFTGQVFVPEGTQSRPGLTFVNDTNGDTGIWHQSDGVFSMVNNGAVTMTYGVGLITTKVPFNGGYQVNTPTGTASNDQGGWFTLQTANSSTLSGGSIVVGTEVNVIQFYEVSGTRRGCYVDLSGCANYAGTRLATDADVASIASSISSLQSQINGINTILNNQSGENTYLQNQINGLNNTASSLQQQITNNVSYTQQVQLQVQGIPSWSAQAIVNLIYPPGCAVIVNASWDNTSAATALSRAPVQGYVGWTTTSGTYNTDNWVLVRTS